MKQDSLWEMTRRHTVVQMESSLSVSSFIRRTKLIVTCLLHLSCTEDSLVNSFKQNFPLVNGKEDNQRELIVIPSYASVQVTMEDRHIIHAVTSCWVLEEGGLEEPMLLAQQNNHRLRQ